MANMSYCRFENTAADLQDCLDHMDDSEQSMSEYEKRGKQRLLKIVKSIAEDYLDMEDAE